MTATVPEAQAKPCCIAAANVTPDTRRGAELRVLLGPKTVGSASGFMGVATLKPGERIAEHYHPYSEEFLYVTKGTLTVDLDGEAYTVRAGEAIFADINVRHRLRNEGTETVEVVFQLGPLAPAPPLGHVDTENADGTPIADAPAPGPKGVAKEVTPS